MHSGESSEATVGSSEHRRYVADTVGQFPRGRGTGSRGKCGWRDDVPALCEAPVPRAAPFPSVARASCRSLSGTADLWLHL